MFNQKYKNTKRNKKILILLIILLFIAVSAGAYFVLVYSKNTNSESSDKGLTTVNYKEATKEEKDASDQNKDDLVRRMEEEKNPKSSSSSSDKRTVVPIISFSGQNSTNSNIEVGGFVPGVSENGGVCTLLLEKQGSRVTVDSPGQQDASTTSCRVITVSRESVSAGDWKATITYSSPTSTGISQPINIKVK